MTQASPPPQSPRDISGFVLSRYSEETHGLIMEIASLRAEVAQRDEKIAAVSADAERLRVGELSAKAMLEEVTRERDALKAAAEKARGKPARATRSKPQA